MFKNRVLVILFVTLAAILLPLKEFTQKNESSKGNSQIVYK